MNGLDGIHTHMTNTMNTPIEALEHSYPLRVNKYALRSNSGGKGLYHGGEGIIRSYSFLEKASVSLLSERRRLGPYGLNGGNKGLTGENIHINKNRKKKLAGKVMLEAEPGDTLTIITPGGGGWGGQSFKIARPKN
jgi:N-methylhydantoinase B